jgi:hypothetical protein
VADGDGHRKLDPASLANLRPIKPGEVRNPTGKNGTNRAALYRAWAEKAPTLIGDKEKSRIENVWEKTYQRAMDSRRKDCTLSAKIIVEQYQGVPKAAFELTNPDGSLGGGQPVVNPLEVMVEAAIKKREMAKAQEDAEEPDSPQEQKPEDK